MPLYVHTPHPHIAQRHLQEQDVVLERVLAHIAAHPPVHHKE